jgi:hypothetical protein
MASRNRNVSVSRCFVWMFMMLLFVSAKTGLAQAVPTATATVNHINLGASFSQYQADYGKRDLTGYAIHADLNRNTRWGIEFEARVLRHNQEVDTHETTFLVGPRFAIGRKWFNPYAKLLIGEGKFHFPYDYAEGSYLVFAPGAGLDVPIASSRFTLRVIDFEYQSWPNFTFGGLNPYGVSAGFSVRIH